MGNDESTARNEQRNSRNVSEAEVNRALEKQRKIYEQRMREILNLTAGTPQAASPVSPGQPSAGAPPRPPAPAPAPARTNMGTATLNANNLERQRNPYSFTTDNLIDSVKQATISPRPLYPNLGDNGNSTASPGNDSATYRRSPNDFVFVNNNFKGAERFSPSAPPAPSSPARDRSMSRSRATADEDGINCPTCKNRFNLKIFNCESGHAVCLNCKLNRRPCGKCGCGITDRRNITMEEYVSEIKVPCLNMDEGCLLHVKLGDMEQHSKECPFQEAQCLLPGGMCRWKGKLSRMSSHFDNFHPTHRGDVDTEMFLQLHNMCENKRMQLIKIGNFNFVFHLIVSERENKIYIAVQLLGTKISAAKWNYEIHVYNKGEPRRKYQFSNKCFATGESIEDIVRDNSCAVLPLHYAKTFINNGAMAYKYFIKKEGYTREERDPSCTRRGGRAATWRVRGGRGRGRGAHHVSN